MELKKLIASRIKELRLSKGLSQKEVADGVGMTEAGYQNYEVHRRSPSLDKLIALADFFGTSADYLLGRSDKP